MKIYATYDIWKLDLLSSYKDIIEDILVQDMNLWGKITDNTDDEEKFQNKLSQSLQFEEQVDCQLKELEKSRKIYIWNQRNSYLDDRIETK